MSVETLEPAGAEGDRAMSEPTRYARKWKADKDAPAPHPAPEVAMRPAQENEIPRAAALMRKRAVAAGWAVAVTYSRGTVLHRDGKPGRVVDSIAVRMQAVNRAAWGVWLNGKYDSGQTWERGYPAPKNLGAKELSKFVSAS